MTGQRPSPPSRRKITFSATFILVGSKCFIKNKQYVQRLMGQKNIYAITFVCCEIYLLQDYFYIQNFYLFSFSFIYLRNSYILVFFTQLNIIFLQSTNDSRILNTSFESKSNLSDKYIVTTYTKLVGEEPAHNFLWRATTLGFVCGIIWDCHGFWSTILFVPCMK